LHDERASLKGKAFADPPDFINFTASLPVFVKFLKSRFLESWYFKDVCAFH